MKIGFAIGNGPSRIDFDLHKLDGRGITVGCNWIFKDYYPDVIVAIDKVMKNEFIGMKDRPFKWLTTNQNHSMLLLDGEKAMPVIEVNRTVGKNSGIIACSYLSKKELCDRVYMLGFDFFRIHPGMKSNDIYHDHLCRYKNFHKAFNVLSDDCLNTEFVRVGPIVEEDVNYFHVMKDHFTFIGYPEFEERLQDEKL
jgi:hypothetical protein